MQLVLRRGPLTLHRHELCRSLDIANEFHHRSGQWTRSAADALEYRLNRQLSQVDVHTQSGKDVEIYGVPVVPSSDVKCSL